jgi:hypothetical protein
MATLTKDFTGFADQNPLVDADLVISGDDCRIVSGELVRLGSGSNTESETQLYPNYTAVADQSVEVTISHPSIYLTGVILMVYADEVNPADFRYPLNGYTCQIDVSTGAVSLSRRTAGVAEWWGGFPTLAAGDLVEGSIYRLDATLNGSNQPVLSLFANGVQQGTAQTDVAAGQHTTGKPGVTLRNSIGANQIGLFGLEFTGVNSVSPPTIDTPTPSGTLGTQTTATLGATTDTNSGTFYGVVDSAANITGITGSQIIAGNNANDAAAVASNSSTVSTTSPSVGVTGLTAGTLYSYAVVQSGGSNVLTGTFTTATNPGLTHTLKDTDTGTNATNGTYTGSVRSASDGATIWTGNVTVTSGVFTIDDDLVGSVNDWVYLTLESPSNVVATYRLQVTNLG